MILDVFPNLPIAWLGSANTKFRQETGLWEEEGAGGPLSACAPQIAAASQAAFLHVLSTVALASTGQAAHSFISC